MSWGGIGVPFSAQLREKLLLWSDRHCCLCKKACGAFISVHHIKSEASGGRNSEDNAIPLCFECHALVHHYADSGPLGTKFKPSELKKRRDQVYEEYTRDLIPALAYDIHQRQRAFPNVGFDIRHPGDTPPVNVLVSLVTYIDGQVLNREDTYGLYRGKIWWNLNPSEGVLGHFFLPDEATDANRDVRIGINITVRDCYGRSHDLLPVTYVYVRGNGGYWFLDPIDPKTSASHAAAFAEQARQPDAPEASAIR
jgi:hypothetical protein